MVKAITSYEGIRDFQGTANEGNLYAKKQDEIVLTQLKTTVANIERFDNSIKKLGIVYDTILKSEKYTEVEKEMAKFQFAKILIENSRDIRTEVKAFKANSHQIEVNVNFALVENLQAKIEPIEEHAEIVLDGWVRNNQVSFKLNKNDVSYHKVRLMEDRDGFHPLITV